ncbi:MAG TPA: helix-turn-helix transcriptional regulator [Tetrasphaera sp.]|nr:helix-turn-helix transcriptional regulator [Tetrasphaera sp.]
MPSSRYSSMARAMGTTSRRASKTMGPQWGGLNIGHVYQVLGRLVRDGYAVANAEQQAHRPDRVVEALTTPGREELDRWLLESEGASAGYRDDLILKVMAASRLGHPDILDATLRVVRRDLLQELRNLAEARRARPAGADERLGELLVAAAELQVRARLEFVERAVAAATRLVTARPAEGMVDPGDLAAPGDDRQGAARTG